MTALWIVATWALIDVCIYALVAANARRNLRLARQDAVEALRPEKEIP